MSIEAVDSQVVKFDEMTFGERLKLEHFGFWVASAIARVLYDEFEVEQVILFGSMTNYELLTRDSDIDIALVGGSPDSTPWGDSRGLFAAIELVRQIAIYCHEAFDLPLFEVDLVLFSQMKPRMQREIKEGTVMGSDSLFARSITREKVKDYFSSTART